MRNIFITLFVVIGSFLAANAQNTSPKATDLFKQLEDYELPTPNTYRNAAGKPGHDYWQQTASYDMDITLDDDKQRIYGTSTITYTNNSPDALSYLWLQLDQNVRAKESDTYKIQQSSINEKMNNEQLERIKGYDFDGGFKIDYVKNGQDQDLPYTINKTMMRVDLPKPLPSGESTVLQLKWWYNIQDRMHMGGRSGYEYFPEDDNYLYAIAQFYPRMVAYTDYEGWQHKQFLGRGEFTLDFGNYTVKLTVPDDHIVAATGTLQNADKVLTKDQQNAFEKAKTAKEPVIIVSESEARNKEKSKSKKTATWEFHADNVRDFAFASSRKFIWDAIGVPFGDRTVMAMSFYPKEGNPLWEQYSTRVVAHTLRSYSAHTFDYPYPVAISVHTDDIGMEYPMICFNWGRPEKDGTYPEITKYRMIGVIIHEVGHNFFPMIVNSDERQWTWMDEGLNTFLQYLTEQTWERNYPSRRGPAYKIVDYMKGDQSNIRPIMTNSESIFQFGNNAYGKPATALNILRETVMGRELFDFAFKEYAQSWKFKHPTPADFFRVMEDASGVDLDWFWRGWFFTTDYVDIALDEVKWYQINTQNPDIEKPLARQANDAPELQFISNERNKTAVPQTITEADKATKDFYATYDEFAVTNSDKEAYKRYRSSLDEATKKMLDEGGNFYELSFKNVGGLVMPILLDFEFTDGSHEEHRIPAEIWMQDNWNVHKVFVTNKTIKQITLDPHLETADCDTANNYWPPQATPSRFELFKAQKEKLDNPMQQQKNK
ncbi:MAG: M1 family metallopeptidase [Chitinophagales bacterium]|nr:M1 family metallopeptidase [Bacteroidota bacterium]MCB9044369.1 M1 family metallopeptidase [Chitinophagales bacterium]